MNAQTPSDVRTLPSSDVDDPEPAADIELGPEDQGDTQTPEPQSDWSHTKALAFRIAFIYFTLFALPFPFGFLPGTDAVARG